MAAVLTRRLRAAGVVTASIALVLAIAPGTAAAVPPPPPNPSDSELKDSRADAKAKAGEVGTLTNRVAQAEAKLIELQADVEAKMEEANKALVDLETAQEVARKAREDAEAARREADGAGQAVEDARKELDAFAAGSFKQGSTIGSMSAYIGASSPEDLLARAQLLNAVSGSQLDALELMERAKITKANKDSAARAALDLANAKHAEAEQAKRDADAATAAAQQAQRDQVAKADRLLADKEAAERELAEAQARVGGLENQRQRYEDWLAAKQREEAAAAAAAGGGRPVAASAGGSVRVVIDRALSQLGVPYAWGGGNANGPTRGIRDGGVADSFGDYNKVGFDCSGLMIYAFAGVGIRLPHYSGYQATAGRRVPLSQMAPGDMLFWATGGRIHHVALYIGNGQMVEAPYSGSRVRIASVRYGGIVPLATRLL
ncbi:MAG TPA: NlpC/P60 family protein [Actinophytocola sp.]|uniref:NlpC/P60 family protein n=1 Tax=Actinophytocola sp. TaxID=1872138 RepID=UPI002DDD133F|nr:NlpC/P60 family protein [Actinophytocola sp.]HEV2779344.1 NlpC/P60 family protein [Actinophytocola sp.]